MPLMFGKGSNVVSANISELRKSGKPKDQSIAIALNKAGKGKASARAKKKVAKKSKIDNIMLKKKY